MAFIRTFFDLPRILSSWSRLEKKRSDVLETSVSRDHGGATQVCPETPRTIAALSYLGVSEGVLFGAIKKPQTTDVIFFQSAPRIG